MTKKLIRETFEGIKKLPDHKLKEVSDFVDSLLNQLEHSELNDQIAEAASESKAFEFLDDEEDLYTDSDLKESYDYVHHLE